MQASRAGGRHRAGKVLGCGRHRTGRMPSWRETRAGGQAGRQGGKRGAGRKRRPPHSPVMLPVCVPTDLSVPEPSKLCI